jgi:hypothetical protein
MRACAVGCAPPHDVMGLEEYPKVSESIRIAMATFPYYYIFQYPLTNNV